MKERWKRQLSYLFFVLLAALAFYAVFHGNDMGLIWASLKHMNLWYLFLSAAVALAFTMMEGVMICYLLRAVQGKADFKHCLRYSFVGFLYSGITPSATGGQPMQLYHMKRDGNSLSASTVVLMTVALVYKLVLVLMGIAMVLFGFSVLKENLGGYLDLFYLGMFLNTALVAVLLVVMIMPNFAKGILLSGEWLLVKLHIFKKSEERKNKIRRFIESYQNAVAFLLQNKKQVLVVLAATFLQRCLVFLLPYIVYRGFGLQGTDALSILMIQMSIYLAVDMLPLPGAQGITELMYRRVFRDIFTPTYVLPSLCVTRGVSFYFLLIVSIIVCAAHHICWKRQPRSVRGRGRTLE